MKSLTNLKGAIYGLLFLGLISPILELISEGLISRVTLIVSFTSVISAFIALRFFPKQS